MGFILKSLGWFGVWVVIIAVGFFVWAWVGEYSPQKVENLPTVGAAQMITGDTIKIVSWNIGYAGLGDDMDYFYDGGASVQTSRGRTLQNMDSIISFLSRHTNADFILLQEVDFSAKRSYDINEYDTLIKHFGDKYAAYSALNFSVDFVPIPLSNPIGHVQAGLVTLSKFRVQSAVRYQYPGSFSWPSRMFNLKRCMLALEIPIADSASLFIGNTHNSAYDDGDMRAGEMLFINEFLSPLSYGVVAGDWNANPPGYKPSAAETTDEYFSVSPVNAGAFSFKGHFAADSSFTARYGYEPYSEVTTTKTIIDFALSTPKLVPISVECVDLKFKNSDHNPIIYKFSIKRGNN